MTKPGDTINEGTILLAANLSGHDIRTIAAGVGRRLVVMDTCFEWLLLSAISDSGIEISTLKFVSAGPSSQVVPKAQIRALFHSCETVPTAFFCESDYLAIQVIKYLTDCGFRDPRLVKRASTGAVQKSAIPGNP